MADDNKDALALFRRLSSNVVSSSFQPSKTDQYGGQVYNRSNTDLESLGTPFGYRAQASGNRSSANGAFSYAKEDDSTACGVYAQAFGRYSSAFGAQAKGMKYGATVFGPNSVVNGLNGVSIGPKNSIIHDNCILVGNRLVSTESGQIQIGARFIVNSLGEIVIDGTNVTQQLSAVMGLPFAGVLGDGRHGAITIASNTTATSPVPIYQCTTLDVQAGKTWTGVSNVPSGFIISVQGRCTIAGTITAAGKGGAGGAPTGATIGPSGFPGFGWAGSGGGGGGGSITGGGMGAPVRAYTPFGGYNDGGVVPGTVNTQWDSDTTTATVGNVTGKAGIYNISATNGGTAGNIGSNGRAISAAVDVTLFHTLWSFFRSTLFGWGSGGGGGGSNITLGTGGAGGGYIVILCDELDFTGTINCNGANGANTDTANGGGGGGGGGGTVIVGYRTLIANSGTVTTSGGTGGTGSGGGRAGGSGGDGYSKIFDMRV